MFISLEFLNINIPEAEFRTYVYITAFIYLYFQNQIFALLNNNNDGEDEDFSVPASHTSTVHAPRKNPK